MIANKDNNLLVEFEFLIDLDLAMYRYIKDNFYNSPLVDKKILSMRHENEIIAMLLRRQHINPLEILIPNEDTTDLYFELMDSKEEELLKYATAYDTFGLMITFLKEASSVSIDVLCKNELESNFIHNLNPILNTKIFKTKFEAPLQLYTVLYTKYFVNVSNYSGVKGKHIYIPAAGYNMEYGQSLVDTKMLRLFGDVNEIHLIDLYKYVKFRFNRKDEDDDADIF